MTTNTNSPTIFNKSALMWTILLGLPGSLLLLILYKMSQMPQ